MILKPTKRAKVVEETTKTTKKSTATPLSMYKDTYEPMFPPKRILVREEPSYKDPEKIVKQYMELSVKRNDEDGTPYAWITMYQESDFYTGYLKGKSVYMPVASLYDLIDGLNDLCEVCDKKGIFDL